jgi:hypothetical protein
MGIRFGAAKTKGSDRRALIVSTNTSGGVEPIKSSPAFDQPERMGAADSELFGAISSNLGRRPSAIFRRAGCNLAQDSVDERGRGTLAGALHQFDTFIDCRAGWNPGEKAKLVHSDSKRDENFRIDPRQRLRRAFGYCRVEQLLPAKSSHN